MKRIFSIIFVALVMSSVSVTAFAQTTDGEDVSKDVKAKYVDGIVAPEVCSVDVSWGAMEFTYSETGTKNWNPETHEYTYNTSSGWSANGNNVTVTNHSNKSIVAEIKFVSVPNYSDNIQGAFDKNVLSLNSAEGLTVADAPKDTAVLTISGKLNTEITDFTKVGTVTVSLK